MIDPTADRLAELVDAFACARRRGQTISVDEFAAQQTEDSDELRSLLRSVAAMEDSKLGHGADDHAQVTASFGFVAAGDRLDDYRLIAEIGRGGMGVVYEAMQLSLGRRVALKLLPPTAFAGGSVEVERFRREAEIASRLHHPSIVPIYAVGAVEGQHFYAMQRIDGASLDAVVRCMAVDREPHAEAACCLAARWLRDGRERGFRPSWQRIAGVARAVGEALAFAHSLGVLHRDVKPSNILLEADGRVWITDFGIAKTIGQDGRTRTGDFLGTLQYAPPEQQDGDVDERGDVYGLGVVLYELVTGRPAFVGSNRRELARRIHDGAFDPPRRVDAAVPRDLDTIVCTAMAFDRSHRYRRIDELVEDLRRFAADLPIAARRVSPWERGWRWCRRNPAIASMAVTAIGSVAVAAIVGWVAYLRTDVALGGEQVAVEQARRHLALAQDASDRAERNLALAMSSFDALFETVAGHESDRAWRDEFGDQVPVVQVISEKDLRLLGHTLDFYGRFAEANADDEQLRVETARAFRRSGDIHRWIGRFDEAEHAYQRAADLYDELLRTRANAELIVDYALVLVQRGAIQCEHVAVAAAVQEFQLARSLMLGLLERDDSARIRFALANVYNTIGAGLARAEIARQEAGGRTEAQVSFGRAYAMTQHRAALDLAERLAMEYPDRAEVQLLLARTHRLLVQATANRRVDAERTQAVFERSMNLLEAMCADEPGSLELRIELAEAYVCAGSLDSDPRAGATRIELGVEIARALSEANPDVPTYATMLADALRRRGIAEARDRRREAAMASLRESLAIREGMFARHPSSQPNLGGLLGTLRTMARIERTGGDGATAIAHLEYGLRVLREASHHAPSARLLRMWGITLRKELDESRGARNQVDPARPQRSRAGDRGR